MPKCLLNSRELSQLLVEIEAADGPSWLEPERNVLWQMSYGVVPTENLDQLQTYMHRLANLQHKIELLQGELSKIRVREQQKNTEAYCGKR